MTGGKAQWNTGTKGLRCRVSGVG